MRNHEFNFQCLTNFERQIQQMFAAAKKKHQIGQYSPKRQRSVTHVKPLHDAMHVLIFQQTCCLLCQFKKGLLRKMTFCDRS